MTGLLEGKVAIITGAASGIGRASAFLFSRHGAKLILVDKNDDIFAISEAVENSIPAKLDVGSESDVASSVDMAIANFGTLDIFYANAGIIGAARGGIFDADEDIWAEVLRVNLIGPALAIKYASPKMPNGGAIIATASVAGIRSGAGPATYSASKAGVINLVQTAAQQLAGQNIRVNAICPGLIETGMTKPAFDSARAKGVEDKIGQLNPLLRAGQPEEIAKVALFLASDLASYVNGQAIAVDGGLSSSHPTAKKPSELQGRAAF